MQRRAQTCGARANYQHIGVVVVPVVAVDIGVVDGRAQACGLADEVLIEHPGAAGRAHKGLVIKAGHKNRRQHRGDGHGVKAHRRPSVLRAGDQTCLQLKHGSGNIGLARAFVAHGEQRVAFFHTGRHDAARSVVLKGTRHQMLAMREQRGRHRVARKALKGLAVERELQALAAINTPALGDTVSAAACWCGSFGLRHGSSLSAAITTDSISCVTVWRLTTSQRRQPRVCCQNSV